jgi:hypothetical protein
MKTISMVTSGFPVAGAGHSVRMPSSGERMAWIGRLSAREARGVAASATDYHMKLSDAAATTATARTEVWRIEPRDCDQRQPARDARGDSGG